MDTVSVYPTDSRIVRRRIVFTFLVLATLFLLSWRTVVMLHLTGWNSLKSAVIVLFFILMIPLAVYFWTAVIGFLVQWRGVDKLDITRCLDPNPSPNLKLPRTAIVMPIYNEDPVRIFAGLRATYESLRQTGHLAHFDLFILSDTVDSDTWVREEMAFASLRGEVSDPERIFYRNRRENIAHKSGNIADFCAQWGDRYTYMIVFDADSIMTGETLVNLVCLMEKNAQVGIVQAPLYAVNRRTLFGRLHQFATHAYSAMFLSGLNFWQGGDGNYWGHNAIVRIQPFVEHCRLPVLPGNPPMGGPILSHDFVEAAFMRRAGWEVWVASDLHGTYEEIPSSLLSHAARERRWCQGNMQHLRLLFTPSFQFVNRFHIWRGVMSYIASPMWLMLLTLTTLESVREHLTKHHYFSNGHSLFPTWPISVEQHAPVLFGLTMGLFLLPKFLSFVLVVRQRARLSAFGGPFRLIASMLSESIATALLAPNMALFHTRFVFSILMGRNVKWDCQDRGEANTSFRQAFRQHWRATLLGVAWAVLLWLTVPRLLLWFSPVLAGFLLAIPFSAWSSRTSLGEWAKARGLFVIPEEINLPPILRDFHEALQRALQFPWANPGDGLVRVLEDPALCQLHLALLPPDQAEKVDPLRVHFLQGLELKYRSCGLSALTSHEKRELLLAPDSIRALRPESTQALVPESQEPPFFTNPSPITDNNPVYQRVLRV